jgi:hypothetical protein
MDGVEKMMKGYEKKFERKGINKLKFALLFKM